MSYITSRLAGFGLALGLLALPLGGLAASVDGPRTTHPQHRYAFVEEGLVQGVDESVARYAMLEMTTLEKIAGRQHLDMDTIRFLEENVWFYESVATPAGTAKAAPKLLSAEEVRFIEDNIWDYESLAGFAGGGSVDEGIVRTARCHGEGLVDPANQVTLGIRDGLVARYCSDHAYAAGGIDDIAGGPDDYESGVDMHADSDETFDVGAWFASLEPMAGNTGVTTDRVIFVDSYGGLHGGIYGIDMGFFSNEIPWQDYVEPVARVAEADTPQREVLPYDAPQLRAEEPR